MSIGGFQRFLSSEDYEIFTSQKADILSFDLCRQLTNEETQKIPPSLIAPRLYLGSEGNALNKDELLALGISHILNTAIQSKCYFPEIFQYNKLAVIDDDFTQLPLVSWVEWIAESLSCGQTVFVHCLEGRSRSASAVIAFLIRYMAMDFQEALDYTKAKRSIVNPNRGFQSQLQAFEMEQNPDRQPEFVFEHS